MTMGTPRKTRKLSSTRNVLEGEVEERWVTTLRERWTGSIRRFDSICRSTKRSSTGSLIMELLKRKICDHKLLLRGLQVSRKSGEFLAFEAVSFTRFISKVSISKEEKNIAVLGAPVDLRSIDLPGRAEQKRREETFRAAAFPAVPLLPKPPAPGDFYFVCRFLFETRATTRRWRWKSFALRLPLERVLPFVKRRVGSGITYVPVRKYRGRSIDGRITAIEVDFGEASLLLDSNRFEFWKERKIGGNCKVCWEIMDICVFVWETLKEQKMRYIFVWNNVILVRLWIFMQYFNVYTV